MEAYDLIVIGAGPGGYLCAQRAAQAGLRTALFEKREVGGTCLNKGCIPTKTLLYSAKMYRHATESGAFGVSAENVVFDHGKVVRRKGNVVKTLVNGVKAALRACKVEVVPAQAHIVGKEDGKFVVEDAEAGSRYLAERLCIATGSSAFVPEITGAKEGLERGFVMTSREALDLCVLPEHLVVVGGGVIGLEMACYYASVGVKVTIVEMLDKIAGATDKDICKVLMDTYGKKGMEFYLSTKLLKIKEQSVVIEQDGKTQEITCDKVLMSVGRRAVTEGVGLENIGVQVEKGAIVTDEHLKTNVENVYAAGDCNGKMMLAHTAYREAEVAVHHMCGIEDVMDYSAVPSVIYTDPEAACIGETLESAKAKGINAQQVMVPMGYSGRYLAENERGAGFVKMILDEEEKLAGVHIVGSYASEIILSAGIMLGTKMTLEEMKKIVFPHPTMGEVVREGLFQFKTQ